MRDEDLARMMREHGYDVADGPIGQPVHPGMEYGSHVPRMESGRMRGDAGHFVPGQPRVGPAHGSEAGVARLESRGGLLRGDRLAMWFALGKKLVKNSQDLVDRHPWQDERDQERHDRIRRKIKAMNLVTEGLTPDEAGDLIDPVLQWAAGDTMESLATFLKAAEEFTNCDMTWDKFLDFLKPIGGGTELMRKWMRIKDRGSGIRRG